MQELHVDGGSSILIEIHGEHILSLCTHIRHFDIIYSLNLLVGHSLTRGATLQ